MGYFDKINLSNKRAENESYEQYKIRLKKNKIKVQEHLRGEVIWNSRELGTRILNKK